MYNHRISPNKFRILFLTIIIALGYLLTSCGFIIESPNFILTKTPSIKAQPTKDATSTPMPDQTPMGDLPQNSGQILLDLAALEPREYIVVRDKWAEGKNALYVITTDGNLIGYLAAGRYFNRASISSDHRWLAYDENSQSYLLNLITGEEIKLDPGCKFSSWAPDGQTLISACKKMLLSYELKNGSWTKTGSLLPDLADFSNYPPEILDETLQFESPVWSPDGQKIAYFISLIGISTTSPSFGPYISTKDCLQNGNYCETYNLNIDRVHNQGKLFWLQDSSQLVIYSFFNNDADLYVYNTEKTNTLIKRLHLTKDELVESFAFSLDDQLIAYRPYSGSVYLFNITTGEKIKIYNGLSWEQLEVSFWLKITQGQ